MVRSPTPPSLRTGAVTVDQRRRAEGSIARLIPAFALAFALAGCATPGDGDGAAGGGPVRGGADAAGGSAAAGRDGSREPAGQTVNPTGKADWVAVYESPPETRYGDQRVVYVDRASVQPQPLDKLTYYLARTREVSRSTSKAKIQELAVLCEGTPNAPATALRGEGTEESNGSYSLKRASSALTSASQFTTARIRPDPNNPGTFVVRAICLIGTEPK
ncbi:MAG: hypothetical protein AB7O55_29080 [Lautropia sp.]